MRLLWVTLLAALALVTPPAAVAKRAPDNMPVARQASHADGIPSTPSGVPEAKHTVEKYFALIRRNRFSEARLLWDHGGADSGGNAAALAASFNRFTKFTATVGDPTAIKINDNTQYIAVSTKADVTDRRTGRTYKREGTVMLRRHVDHAKRWGKWRIWGMDLREKH